MRIVGEVGTVRVTGGGGGGGGVEPEEERERKKDMGERAGWSGMNRKGKKVVVEWVVVVGGES